MKKPRQKPSKISKNIEKQKTGKTVKNIEKQVKKTSKRYLKKCRKIIKNVKKQ